MTLTSNFEHPWIWTGTNQPPTARRVCTASKQSAGALATLTATAAKGQLDSLIARSLVGDDAAMR